MLKKINGRVNDWQYILHFYVWNHTKEIDDGKKLGEKCKNNDNYKNWIINRAYNKSPQTYNLSQKK